jgi:anthranilate/para-aminobenzoate synthase component I
MLVDLGQNDLSRNGQCKCGKKYREVQFFLTSPGQKVTGHLHEKCDMVLIQQETLSAPKHRAMQLIEEYENKP